MTLIGVIHNDHFQWLENKSIEGVIYEKTAKLLNSNIFINKQVNNEIGNKIEKSLEKNTSNKYFFGKDFNIAKFENGFIQYQDQLGELVLPEPSILGDHQLYNISTAIAASRKIFSIKDENIVNGIKNISLKARLEEIKSGKLKNIVTVVGTNAKASMCYSFKSILNEAGYKTNLYTSPHLLSYTERYVFEDKEIN